MTSRVVGTEVLALLLDGIPRRVQQIALAREGGIGVRRERVEEAVRSLVDVGGVERRENRQDGCRVVTYAARLWDGAGPESENADYNLATADKYLRAASRYAAPGFTAIHTWVLTLTLCHGEPLDPCEFDDAALLVRADALVASGMCVRQALRTAREEMIRSSP